MWKVSKLWCSRPLWTCLALGIGPGLFFGLLYSLMTGGAIVEFLVAGAVVGQSISFSVSLTDRLLIRQLLSHDRPQSVPVQHLLRAALWYAAAVVGVLLGVAILRLLFWPEWGDDFVRFLPLFALLNGVIGVAVAAVMFGYGRLKEQMAAHVMRLSRGAKRQTRQGDF